MTRLEFERQQDRVLCRFEDCLQPNLEARPGKGPHEGQVACTVCDRFQFWLQKEHNGKPIDDELVSQISETLDAGVFFDPNRGQSIRFDFEGESIYLAPDEREVRILEAKPGRAVFLPGEIVTLLRLHPETRRQAIRDIAAVKRLFDGSTVETAKSKRLQLELFKGAL